MDKGLARAELRSYLLDFLARSLPDDRFRHPVQEMLSVPGFILSDNPRSLVPIGALLCYEAASQRPWSDAVPAAASLELAFYASEFVDKGLDQEALRPSEQWEVLKGVNAGYCLQLLAARSWTSWTAGFLGSKSVRPRSAWPRSSRKGRPRSTWTWTSRTSRTRLSMKPST